MIVYQKFNLSDFSDCLIVTDELLGELYGIKGDNVYYLPRGESAKSFENVQSLCRWFLSRNLERRGRVVAVGGGSVGDTVGFAASIYKRGVALTHVPTTLVAQIDSSIGGKTAIDLDGVKNAVGTFYSADTLIDIRFLQTLSQEQILCGQGELLKYRMLSSEIDGVFARGNVENTVRACAEYKSNVCSLDPYDSGVRRRLNFGHTVGHALELSCGLTHGAAVANGIYYATNLAYKLGKCAKSYRDEWTDKVKALFPIVPLSREILELTRFDKKNVGGKVTFVLPDAFDETSVSTEELISLLL